VLRGLAETVVRGVAPDATMLVTISIAFWTVLAALVVAHAIVLRWIERRPWSFVGLSRDAARPPLLALALAVGALAIAVPMVILLGIGWLDLEPAPDGSSWRFSLLLAALFLPAAMAEELALRGYIFALIREAWGWRAAIALTSVVFGLLHLANPGADVQSITVVVLAGFFLGGVLLATGSLYAAWMAHFAWNWVMGALFHTPVSGIEVPPPEYRIIDAGPDWATGGEWGPEGGALAAFGMVAGMAYLMMLHRGMRGSHLREDRQDA
jgi:membrane protease YdiL (CAAX protease family)